MIVYKLYYQNLLDITPTLFTKFNALKAAKEDQFFVVYLRLNHIISKAKLIFKLTNLNIPLPYYIYIINTKTRKTNYSCINKHNVNKLINKEKINKILNK